MAQATLSAWTLPSPEVCLRGSYFVPEKIKVYDCRNCVLQKGFAASKVRCFGTLRDIPLGGCPCYSDGNDLEFMASIAPPPGWQAKKYAGE
jgi:hypothetical protein